MFNNKHMALITITSDLGTRDYYLAALKGAIISHCEKYVPMVDVTHQVKAYDIKEAAFTVRNMYKYYPKGTIHIVHVNSTDSDGKLLLAIVDGHYFITFDNGFLSLAFERMPHQTYEVNAELMEGASLMYEEAIAKVCNFLINEYKPSDFAHLTTEAISYRSMQPITRNGSIRGSVIYIDNYGNAVSNITRATLSEHIGDKPYSIFVNVANTKAISKFYNDVEEGEMVCLFNSAGYLEVAINKGKAENLLGLKLDSAVLVMVD